MTAYELETPSGHMYTYDDGRVESVTHKRPAGVLLGRIEGRTWYPDPRHSYSPKRQYLHNVNRLAWFKDHIDRAGVPAACNAL